MILGNICILSGGVLTVLMIVFHCFFYKLFQWEKDFKEISVRNKKILVTIHLALIGAFFIFSFISLFFYNQLNSLEPFNFSILLLLALFWFLRCIWQIFYFRQTKKPNNNSLRFMHYILVIVFLIISVLYIIPVVDLIF